MLKAEAEILSLDLDCFRLLQSYRETCLDEKAERARTAEAEAKEEAEVAERDNALEADEARADEATQSATVPFDVEKGDPWVDRICELDGVEPDRLCELHGKLIAAGFISFQIRNRTTGVEYRVANAGKQYLTRKLTQASELTAEHPDSSDLAAEETEDAA